MAVAEVTPNRHSITEPKLEETGCIFQVTFRIQKILSWKENSWQWTEFIE